MPPTITKPENGVLFPADPKSGKRSTLSGGKAVFSAAAKAVDEKLSNKIASEKDFRGGYEKHVVALMEAGSASPTAAIAIAEAGLAAVYSSFEFMRDGKATSLAEAMASPSAAAALSTASVTGSGLPFKKVVVPYEGTNLENDALLKELKKWTEVGTQEPGVETGIAHIASGGVPDLSDKVFIVLGATSALGPLQHLLKWGATVIGVARKKPQNWSDLITMAKGTTGTLMFPVSGDPSTMSEAELAASAGADLMVDTPELLAWLKTAIAQANKPNAIVGMYTYLDSDAHVRVTIGADLIMSALSKASGGPCNSLAYIQTPSLAYDIPEAAWSASKANYGSSWLSFIGYSQNARPPVKGTSPPRYVHDGMINMQGPNYALAKTIQMWRSTLARARDGLIVSANCAPPARTASMVAGDNKNAGAVAVGLNGMGHFRPFACFDQETVSACMAALLVHDVTNKQALSQPSATMVHPYDLFSHQAFHGGGFRVGVKPSQLSTLFYIAGKLRGPASAL